MPRRPEADGLSLPAALATQLLEHASGELPNESCALLGGDPIRGQVTSVHPARNRLASPYRYDVEPRDLVRIVHQLEEGGDALVAIFHSHPRSSAVPSRTDVREARYRVVHLLASLTDAEPVLRAWTIEAATAREVPLTIAP
jgi:[CysO sulfur-carrier protein]-S-L-cysteine hydrolase